jgi:hypothetical protein
MVRIAGCYMHLQWHATVDLLDAPRHGQPHGCPWLMGVAAHWFHARPRKAGTRWVQGGNWLGNDLRVLARFLSLATPGSWRVLGLAMLGHSFWRA